MLIFKITLFVSFMFLIIGYSYILLTPGLLVGCTPVLTYIKKIAQVFITFVFVYGFKSKFKLAESSQDISSLINSDKNKIDVVICNHTSTLDFLIMMIYFQEFQIDSYNFVLKKDILYTPGFGYVMYSNPDIKLNRNWEQDKETMGKQLDNIKLNGKKQVILIFPEGTRLTEKKLKEGQEFSKANNLPIYENLMVPKSKGLWFITNKLTESNKLGKVWDVTIILPHFLKKTIGITDIFGKNLGDIKLIWREVQLNQNYQEYEEFKKWLLELWITKDSFMKHHDKIVFKEINPENTISTIDKISIIILFTILCVVLFNKYGRYYLLGSLILSYILIVFKL